MSQALLRKPLLLCAVILTGAAAQAADSNTDKERVERLFSGNSLTVDNRYGPSFIYFDPSGVLVYTLGNGETSKGTWRATADSICSTSEPAADGRVFPEYCMKVAGRKLHERWTAEDPRNGTISYHLLPGDLSKRLSTD